MAIIAMATTQQSCASIDDAPTAPAPARTLTLADIGFLAFTATILLVVVWLGHLAYMEGMKTEVTKANGEAWAKWFTDASSKRFMPGFSPVACAGVARQATPAGTNGKSVDNGNGNKAAADASANLSPSPSWGECLEALTQDGAQFAALRNPFAGKPLAIAAKCDSSDRTLAGALVLEKLTPTPPGSAVPNTASPLIGADVIEQKLQVRITVCDKGAYPIRIAELDF